MQSGRLWMQCLLGVASSIIWNLEVDFSKFVMHAFSKTDILLLYFELKQIPNYLKFNFSTFYKF